MKLEIRDLGRIGYADAWALQRELHAAVLQGRQPPTFLLLEHEPVITVSQRDTAWQNLRATAEFLKRQGIEVAQTDRGGDITYHGPGQLVVYPIVPLQPLGLNVRQYVAALEEAIIQALGEFGVTGRRDPAGIGVWVEVNAERGTRNVERAETVASCELRVASFAKIAAIGVRVRRWITLHGLALNVTTDLTHFRHIVPCGLDKPVTSLQQLLGPQCPAMDRVKQAMARSLRSSLRI